MTIEFINKTEIQASLQKLQKEKLAKMPQVAAQMGFLALNEIRSNCAVKTGNWRDSWTLEVTPQEDVVLLRVYSPGAFAENGFNYGELQEKTRHPGAIGWHRVQPMMWDLFRTSMMGEESNLVMAPSEFSSMSGMV